ncbi:hypothetical protein GCM10010156_36670 [Planobispora rosea]|uniref:Uncharacterized protein n=1 Tax=Planobispora rosea TaxID=35762 RepID=A0A8J3RX12_PLARO|nr:hypothetical protein [Planobispora rosea]GGS74389.1 hypothetical protein GCM10010156_36670 [Planobispora rosea]GIH81741.1 hypothetical protein Pro02_01490 [Planobispora rosea]
MDEQRVRAVRRGVGIAIRVALLMVLLGGALVVSLSFAPSSRTLEEFRTAMAAGRIAQVTYWHEGGDISRLVWSEGSLIWHAAVMPTGESPDAYSIRQLRRDIGEKFVRAEQADRRTADSNWILPDWPFYAPLGAGVWVVGAAWVITFLTMLGSTPRLGNGWAWFWLFTVGQVGAILFLLLEPRPIWYGAERHPKPRGRVSGGSGCLLSVGLGFLSAVAAVGVGQLAGLLLG